MRVSRNGRKRRAVLSALAAVREQGMTLVALAHAVDLPEPELLALLHQLMLTEHVQCVQEVSSQGYAAECQAARAVAVVVGPGGIQGVPVKASRMASMGRRPWLRALTM